MRVLVCGSRKFTLDLKNLVRATLSALDPQPTVIIQGGAKGADDCAKWWAENRGIPVIEFKADWKAHGNYAGPIRNSRMLNEGRPDLVLVFPGGLGTANMASQAVAAGVPVRRVE